jgi:hypothetical protein
MLFLHSGLSSNSAVQVDHLVVPFLLRAIFDITSGLDHSLSLMGKGASFSYVTPAVGPDCYADSSDVRQELFESSIHESY